VTAFERLFRERPEKERPDKREDRHQARRAAARTNYQAEVVWDLGAYGILVDTGVLRLLGSGLNSERVHALEGRLRERRSDEGKERRALEARSPGSFVSGLGIGFMHYADFDL